MRGRSRWLLPLLSLPILIGCAHDPLAGTNRPKSTLKVFVSDEHARRPETEYAVDADRIFYAGMKKAASRLFDYDEAGYRAKIVPRVAMVYITDSRWDIERVPIPGAYSRFTPKAKSRVWVRTTLEVTVRDAAGRAVALVEETIDNDAIEEMEQPGSAGGYLDGKASVKIVRARALRKAVEDAVAQGIRKIADRALDDRLAARVSGELPPLREVARKDVAAEPGGAEAEGPAAPEPAPVVAAALPAAAAEPAPAPPKVAAPLPPEPLPAPEAAVAAPSPGEVPKPVPPPRFALAEMRVDDAGGDGTIDPGEIVEVTARIGNDGEGAAADVSAEVEFGTNVFPVGAPPRFSLGPLAAGERKDIAFAFRTGKKSAPGGKIPVAVRVRDARTDVRASLDLGLSVAAPKPAPPAAPPQAARAVPPPTRTLEVDREADIPEGEKAGPDDVAFVIGNRHYFVPGVPDVDFALRDAESVKGYLLKAFGYRPENVIFEPDATFARLNEIFGTSGNPRGRIYRLVRTAGGAASVFIYYSGHGAPDLDTGEAYLLPVDANPQYVGTSGYPLAALYENLSKLPVKRVTLVLDACFSGNTDQGLLFRGISPAMLKVKKGADIPRNALLLASAAADQVSAWYPEKGHSLFTYFFLKGIQGEADADGDGAITAGEMKGYLGKNVPYWSVRLKNVDQTPVVVGDEDEVLVRLKR